MSLDLVEIFPRVVSFTLYTTVNILALDSEAVYGEQHTNNKTGIARDPHCSLASLYGHVLRKNKEREERVTEMEASLLMKFIDWK